MIMMSVNAETAVITYQSDEHHVHSACSALAEAVVQVTVQASNTELIESIERHTCEACGLHKTFDSIRHDSLLDALGRVPAAREGEETADELAALMSDHMQRSWSDLASACSAEERGHDESADPDPA